MIKNITEIKDKITSKFSLIFVVEEYWFEKVQNYK